MNQTLRRFVVFGALLVISEVSGADKVSGADNATEMAKKLQDPLANISAVMTDNDILFKTGDDETSYSFQFQPVQAWSFDEQGFNFIARGVIPILSLAPESQTPAIGDPV